MATVLVPLPRVDFDPTETGVPWRVLADAGHDVVFATPDGAPAQAGAVADHDRMARSAAWRAPLAWTAVADGLAANRFDALLLPGGHAPGMRDYLESPLLQAAVAIFFERDLPVAALRSPLDFLAGPPCCAIPTACGTSASRCATAATCRRAGRATRTGSRTSSRACTGLRPADRRLSCRS